MNKDKSPYIYIEEKEFFLEDVALSILLEEDVIRSMDDDENKIILYVPANDTFGYACADGEDLTFDQIKNLYNEWQKDKEWGWLKWICKQRQQLPLKSLQQMMKEEGSWNEELEKLKTNI